MSSLITQTRAHPQHSSLGGGSASPVTNRSLSRIDIHTTHLSDRAHELETDEANLSNYLNDDAILSAGAEDRMMMSMEHVIGGDRSEHDAEQDPLEMDLNMEIGGGSGSWGLDLAGDDGGMRWGNVREDGLDAASPDAFLSEDLLPIPFSPSIPTDPQSAAFDIPRLTSNMTTVTRPEFDIDPFDPHRGFHFPNAGDQIPNLPMSLPPGFTPSVNLDVDRPHGFMSQSQPTAFSLAPFHAFSGGHGSYPQEGTIPGAFLQQQTPLGAHGEGLGEFTGWGSNGWASSMDSKEMSIGGDESGIRSIAGTAGFVSPPGSVTGRGPTASATKSSNSKRRTSTASSGTGPKGFTALAIAPATIEVRDDAKQPSNDTGSTPKRPSKRQRCDSEAASIAGSTVTSVSSSSMDGFGIGSLNGSSSFLSNSMEGLMSSGEGDGSTVVKVEEEEGSTSVATGGETDDLTTKGKKRKPFKPWNTSPASSHLPSGSACINPVTGEVELPALDNLTKEEIRKVKNRASAQRSRTRKVEWASGLREENDQLRQEIDVLRAGLEGAAMGSSGGMGMGGPPGSVADQGEKQMLKALIKTLRSEVQHERASREKVNAEVVSLRAQLAAAKASIEAAVINNNTNNNDSNVPGQVTALPSPDRTSDGGSEIGADFERHQEEAERGELISVRGGKRELKAIKKDGKGVLMMVVLFSFALFSMPPNLRSHTLSAAFPSRLTSSGRGDTGPGLLGRVLPFDDLVPVNRTEDTDLTCADSAPAADVDDETEESLDKCPALGPFSMIGPEAKFQRMTTPLGQGLPGMTSSGVRGRQSLSLTLLKPYDKETSEIDQKGEVEDVLERWLGLSLFDEERGGLSDGLDGDGNETQTPTTMPGAWVVVKAMPSTCVAAPEEDMALQSDKNQDASPVAQSGIANPSPSFKAWDGSPIEPMELDSRLLTISAGGKQAVGDESDPHAIDTPFQPDLRKGFEATLAPEISMEDLLESSASRSVPGRLGPGLTPSAASGHRRASDASTTSTISVHAPFDHQRQSTPSAALMALTSAQTATSQAKQLSQLQTAERYVKLELEVDLEMELTCKAVRRGRRTTVGAADFGFLSSAELGTSGDGFSVVNREELGGILHGSEAFKPGRRPRAFMSSEV